MWKREIIQKYNEEIFSEKNKHSSSQNNILGPRDFDCLVYLV